MKRLLSIISLCMLCAVLFAQQTYTLTVNTLPQGLGLVNVHIDGHGQPRTGTYSVPAGSSLYVYLQDMPSGWKVANWRTTQGTASLSPHPNSPTVELTMPAENLTLTAVMEFNPDNPDNPMPNGWYPAEGKLVIDYMNGQDFMSQCRKLIPDAADYALVQEVVAGGYTTYGDILSQMTAQNFPNLLRVDISRVNGQREDIGAWYYYRNLPWTELLLPPTVKRIRRNTFQDTWLEALTIYATTPPELSMENILDEQGQIIGQRQDAFPSSRDMTVYVPEESLPLYQAAPGWKEFNLLPIIEDAANLTVNVKPSVGSLADYFGMTLELLNVKSLLSRSMLISNRSAYKFATLPKNTQYQVRLLSSTGSVVGQVDNVFLGEEDLMVDLAQLKRLCTLQLQVAQGATPVDQQKYSCLWLNSQGRVLSRSTQLGGIVEDETVQAVITLTDRELQANYRHRDTITISRPIDHQASGLSYQLKPMPTYRLTTTVQRADGQFLGRQSVRQNIYRVTSNGSELVRELTFSDLTPGGGISSGAIDPLPEGIYDVTVRVENTDLSTSSQRIQLYSDQTVDFRLSEAAGSTLRLAWRHYGVAGVSEQADAATYTDRQITEASITIRDLTNGVELKNFSVRPGGTIRLQEQLEAGTQVEVTIGARGNAQFMPVSQTAAIDSDGSANLSITTRDFGSLNTVFRQTECTSVSVKVFDASGQLVASHLCNASNNHTFTRLPDGPYTIVFLDGSSSIASAMTSMADVEKYLVENSDFSRVAAVVASGTTAEAVAPAVPAMGDNVNFYTEANQTRISPKRSSMMAGLYQTLSMQAVFRPQYKGRISQVKAVFTVPDDMHFIEGSVLMNSLATAYDYSDGQLSVPLVEHRVLRFCVVPTAEGQRIVSGKLTFLLDGEPCEQPLPTTAFSVEAASIRVPEVCVETTVPVVGTALPGADVTVVVNDEEVGTVRSNNQGEWQMNAPLSLTYNMAVNRVYAYYSGLDGSQLKTPVTSVTLDKGGIRPLSVTMTHFNKYYKKNQTVVFDLEKNDCQPRSYYFFREAEFTFDIQLNVTDETYVDDVMLYVYCGQTPHSLQAKFNPQTGHWMASHTFNASSLPTQVAVYVTDHAPKILGEQGISDRLHFMDVIIDEARSGVVSVQQQTEAIDGMTPGSDEEQKAVEDLMVELGINPNGDDDTSYPDTEEGFQQWLSDAQTAIAELDALYKEYELDGPGWTITDPTPFNQLGIVVPGYTMSKPSAATRQYVEARSRATQPAQAEENPDVLEYTVPCENGSNVFMRMNDNGYTLVLLDEDLQIDVDFSAISPELAASVYELRAAAQELQQLQAQARSLAGESEDGFIASIMRTMSKVKDAMLKLNSTLSQWADWMNYRAEKCEQAYKALNKSTQKSWELFHKCKADWGPRAGDIYRSLRGKASKAMQEAAELKELKGMFEKLRGSKILGPIFAGLSLYGDYNDFVDICMKTISAYESVPKPCPKDQSKADAILGSLRGWGSARIIQKGAAVVADVTSLVTAITGLIAGMPTGGFSVAVGAGVTIGISAANWIGGLVFDYAYKDYFKDINQRIKELHCNCEPNDPDCKCPPGDHSAECCKGDKCCTGPGCGPPPPPPGGTPIMDPSGYVFEAVASNRVQDALASVYYKDIYEDMYGDSQERIVLWDAEEFAQVNPMLTDENGEYGWDVPAGLWQVRVVKDGYLDTQSEWLPVPPPQLDVNLSMTQPSAPVVSRVVASEQGVEVGFDKYMKPAHLTPNNIFVTRAGQKLDGTIRLLDSERTPDSTKTFARRVLFVPAQKLSVNEKVQLTVKAGVESYANVGMVQDFTQEFDVQQCVAELVADSVVGILYGEEHTLEIAALPASAAAGQKVLVSSLNNDIVGLQQESVTLDANGRATLTFSGRGYGTTALRMQLAEDPEVQAMTVVGVRSSEGMMTRIPTASLISGIEVKYGTTLRLQSATPDAQIYYTLDGTCPCDNPNRLRYDGSIVLTKDVTVKAMAVAPGYAESDVATFTYKVIIPEAIETAEGDQQLDPVYDLKGVQVDAEKPMNKGVYLKRGKKVVVNLLKRNNHE